MTLKQTVLDAFATLEIDVNASQVEAQKAYKTAALRHHPDKNRDDPNATQKFQEIGAAWNTLTKHYEDPRTSEQGYRGAYDGAYDEDDDDLDFAFFMYMFQETMQNRYSRSSGRQYRRGTGGLRIVRDFDGSIYVVPADMFEPSYPGSFPRTYGGGSVRGSQSSGDVQERQEREKKAYEKRLREFEREMKEEEQAKAKAEREQAQARDALALAYVRAFEYAENNDFQKMCDTIESFNLDVNAPEKMPKSSNPSKSKKQGKDNDPEKSKHATLLHTAARKCSMNALQYLLDKGANPAAENASGLMPFHVAIASGNAPAVDFFLSKHGKLKDGCHPSKAAGDGRTPLQIAVSANRHEAAKLLVKHATVHDVQKLWSQDETDSEMKEILESKKGFEFPASTLKDENGQPLSKKALKKLEQKRKDEEKAARLKEEAERAAENRRRKQEKKEKWEAENAVKEYLRKEKEEEERKIREEEERVRRMKEEEERRAEEDRRRQELYEKKVREEEERQREEAARRAAALEEARRLAELEARLRADVERKAEEERIRAERAEKEARRLEALRREEQARREAEQARQEAIEEEERRQRRAEEAARKREAAQREAEEAAERRRMEQAAQDDEHKKEAEAAAAVKAQRAAEKAAARKDKLRQKKFEAKAPPRPVPPTDADEASWRAYEQANKRYDAKMRRRAEQSARDRARNQASTGQVQAEATPSAAPLAQPEPESIQTCETPEDLFPRSRAAETPDIDITSTPTRAFTTSTSSSLLDASASPTVVGSDEDGLKLESPPTRRFFGRGRGRGRRGWWQRGRGRGMNSSAS